MKLKHNTAFWFVVRDGNKSGHNWGDVISMLTLQRFFHLLSLCLISDFLFIYWNEKKQTVFNIFNFQTNLLIIFTLKTSIINRQCKTIWTRHTEFNLPLQITFLDPISKISILPFICFKWNSWKDLDPTYIFTIPTSMPNMYISMQIFHFSSTTHEWASHFLYLCLIYLRCIYIFDVQLSFFIKEKNVKRRGNYSWD